MPDRQAHTRGPGVEDSEVESHRRDVLQTLRAGPKRVGPLQSVDGELDQFRMIAVQELIADGRIEVRKIGRHAFQARLSDQSSPEVSSA